MEYWGSSLTPTYALRFDQRIVVAGGTGNENVRIAKVITDPELDGFGENPTTAPFQPLAQRCRKPLDNQI